MNFAQKLKNARRSAGMSQETLAERLGVSRQAVTKWETDRGIPDIENMIVISNLFGVTVDDLLSQEKEAAVRRGYLYESRTEYDIDGEKRFDIKLGGAASLAVSGTEGEKIVVRLMSDQLSTLESDLKVKIDDIKGRIDVDLHRKNGMTEARTKEDLSIEVLLPAKYLSRVELEINCGQLRLGNLVCPRLEFSGKAEQVLVESVRARLELDCNIDMQVRVEDFAGYLAINQISSTSRLSVTDDFSFRSVVKGLRTAVSYQDKGLPAADFSDTGAENVVEFNGVKSELVISRGNGVK